MADPKWKLLTPIWGDAVTRLCCLMGGHLLDSLLSEGILTHEQYSSLLNSLRKKEAVDDVARDLLLILVKTPPPNFDHFRALLDTKIDRGKDFLRLFERSDTPPSLPEAASLQPSSVEADHSRLVATATLSSSRQIQFQSESGQVDLYSRRILIVIEVAESLREDYELHKRAIKDSVRNYLEHVYPGKEIELNDNVTELSWRKKQRKERMKMRRTTAFALGSRPKMRILFPRSDSASFDHNRENIVTYLCRLMGLKKDEFEVDITEGSITLQVHVPGRGLINMLNHLEQNAESLKFLLDVDALAKLSFGEFPYVSVSLLCKKSLQRATVESTKIVAQVSPSVNENLGLGDKLLPEDSHDETRKPRSTHSPQSAALLVSSDVHPCELDAAQTKLRQATDFLIEVIKSLKNDYLPHQAAIKASIQNYLENAYPGKQIKLDERFPTELSQTRNSFALGHKPKMRILYLNRNFDRLELTNVGKIKTHVSRVMQIKKSEVKIKSSVESEDLVTLEINVPSRGLLNMLTYLERNPEPLKFLLEIDNSARISFGSFPYVSVSVFGSKRAAVRGTAEVARVLKKVLKKELNKAVLCDRCQMLARGRDLHRAVDYLQDHQSKLHEKVTRISFQDFQPTAQDPTVPLKNAIRIWSRKRLQVEKKIGKLRRALFYTFQKTGQRVKRSALHCACLCGYRSDAMRLLDSGYNVDAQSNSGETPLIASCKTGNLDVVKFLSSKGCNIHLRDTWGRDALHHACANGYVLIAEFLIDCGSNLNTVDFKEERTALISACFNDLNGSHEGVVRLLVAKGCDVLAKDRSGFPAFFYVTKKASKRLARFILETGCPQPRESDDKRFCQVCDLLGKEKTEATFFCTKCKGAQYFCDQCVEESHSESEHWKQEQGAVAARETYHSLMIGVQNPAAMPLPTVLNLEHLLDDEDDEKFLEGFVTLGGRVADRLRQAVKNNKEKGVGLAACLRPFLVDLLVRRERLSTFTELLCCFHDKRDDSDIPEVVLDLTAKDVAIALLETIPDDTKLFVMKRLDSMGYPLPLCYFMKPATQQSTCIANFGALSSVLPGSSSPLILSCGTFNTVKVGKTFLLKELIAKLSVSINTDLLDDDDGPTHNPSIDLSLERKGTGDFNYADIHGWNNSSNFSAVVTTLASVSYLILLHVSEDDVKDLISHEPSAVRFLLKEQLRSAHAILVVLIRDTENEKLREEAETIFRKAFPSGREVISILVKNLKSEKGSRLDRVIKTVLQRLETFFNSPQEKELQAGKLKCPPSEYLHDIYEAKRRQRSPPRLRMRTSLGEALVNALANTYEENKILFSKVFPFTTIKSKIAQTHALEKEIIEAKNKHKKYIKECEEERRRLKTARVRVTNVAEPLKLFSHVIKSNDPKLFAEFQYYLEEWKTEHTDRLYKRRQRLHYEIKELKLKKNSREASDRIVQAEEEYRQNSSALDEIDVSVDSFWSEIMHMYNLEAKNKSKQLTSIFALAPATVRMAYLDYLKQGFAMQLLQGRPLQIAGQFMRDILRELDRQESSKEGKDLFVVSVIGEQSSGKSTLLNSLFGCGFSTAAGKCTKGLFASHLKLSTNKSLLVLDFEGLLSIGGGGRVFDGQITLLALACSDLVIINHRGEISSELNDLLQVCLYAMDTLKVAKIKPIVAFVLRDQRDCRNERVHQTALLKMQEAMLKAVSTSSKDVDDLIEIGSDSLFLLHSAFSETTRGTRSIEMPSLKFSRETFRLRKKIIQSLEKGNIVHTALKNGSTSRPLSDWYTHASYVWKTVTKHGHSLLYCKTVREICLRQELGDIANEVVRKELNDESKGFKMLARLSFDKFLKELNRAESEDVINRVGRHFNGELEEIMDSAIKGLQHKFDEMTAEKQYEEFKASFKNSLSVPVRHEYDFQREKWKMKENDRKQELHLTLTKELLKRTKFQRALSTEEAEALFKKQWEEFEPKAMARLGVKKSMDETRAEVYRLFAQVAASTRYKVGERSSFVTMPQTKLFSKQNGLFLDQDWAKYVNASSNKSAEKKGGSFIVSMVNSVVSFFAKPEDFVQSQLEVIKSKVEVIVKDLVVSLTGPNTQPFGHKLVKATIDGAVSVTEKAEESFSPKDGFQFLTTQFMTDFVITLVNESINCLLAQQKRNEERAKMKLLEDKKDQRRCFLAVLKDRTDIDTA